MKNRKITCLLTYLMIFLMLFNFYSCSKANMTSPISQKVNELQIYYLDNLNNITEEKTDSIVMKLKDEAESFFMYSKKTAKNEYTCYLTENESGVVISMVYKNGYNFPSDIRVFKDGKLAVGTITQYREKTQNYDIIWYMDDEVETFSDINISKKDINTPNRVSNLDTKLKYQVEIVKNSLLIWQSIDEYNNSTSSIAYSIKAKNWAKKLVGIFLAVVSIALMAVMPFVVSIILPTTAAVITGAVGGAMAATSAIGITVASNIIRHSDEKTEEKKDNNTQLNNKKLIINILNNNNLIKNDDFFRLDAYNQNNNILDLNIKVIENDIKQALVSAEVSDKSGNYYSSIRKYFTFYTNGSELVLNENYDICNIDIAKGCSIKFSIKKLQNITDKIDDREIYITFIFNTDNIEVNNRAGKKFRIRIN